MQDEKLAPRLYFRSMLGSFLRPTLKYFMDIDIRIWLRITLQTWHINIRIIVRLPPGLRNSLGTSNAPSAPIKFAYDIPEVMFLRVVGSLCGILCIFSV